MQVKLTVYALYVGQPKSFHHNVGCVQSGICHFEKGTGGDASLRASVKTRNFAVLKIQLSRG